MTEKLKKHIMKIDANGNRKNCRIVFNDSSIGVTDSFRVIVLPADVASEINLPEKTPSGFDEILRFDSDARLNYKRVKLPPAKAFKERIRAVAGPRSNTRVLWSPDGILTYNARWLIEAMDALHAKSMYAPIWIGNPIILYQGDEVNAAIKEYIWPTKNKSHSVGFFVPLTD